MPEDNPSKIVKASECGITLSGVNKIVDYGLQDLVADLHNQSYSFKKIAEACNDDLSKRNDGNTYVEINAVNVGTYIKKGLEKYQISVFGATPTFEFDERVCTALNIIESELDKCRRANANVDPINQSFFIRLIAAYKGILEMTVKAKEEGGVDLDSKNIVNVFMQKITNITNKVKDSDLPSETKGSIIDMVLSELPTTVPEDN